LDGFDRQDFGAAGGASENEEDGGKLKYTVGQRGANPVHSN
jgi:hypothetical protein